MSEQAFFHQAADLKRRVMDLERALQKVLDTPAPGSMTAEQFKSRITGGIVETLHARPSARPVPPTEPEYWHND